MSEYIEFSVDSDARLKKLQTVVAVLQAQKRGQPRKSTAELEAIFGSDALAHFDRPGAAAREQRRHDLETKPVVELPTENAAGARWDFDSMIHSIMDGDYDILGCDRVDGDTARLNIYADAYPYGGVGGLVAVVEAFGFRVTGIDDGTGYIRVSRGEK
jgi:hypothetical protein